MEVESEGQSSSSRLAGTWRRTSQAATRRTATRPERQLTSRDTITVRIKKQQQLLVCSHSGRRCFVLPTLLRIVTDNRMG
jgi:hypothetical protein